MLPADVLQHGLEMGEAAPVRRRDPTFVPAILIPAPARICPHSSLHHFLRVDVVILQALLLDVDALDVLAGHLAHPPDHVVGLERNRGDQVPVRERTVGPVEDEEVGEAVDLDGEEGLGRRLPSFLLQRGAVETC